MSAFPLRNPIKLISGETVSSLNVRDYLTGGDVLNSQKAHPGSQTEQSYYLIGKMCGIDLPEVLQLDVRDIRDLDEACVKIMDPKSPPKA